MAVRSWLGATTALVLAGCGTATGVARQDRPPLPGHGTVVAVAGAKLVSYDSCSQLVSQLQRQALAEVGPSSPVPGSLVGSGGTYSTPAATPVAESVPAGAVSGAPVAAAAEAAPAADGAAGSPPAYSTTNDQEQGVDEPDLAKTDGQLLVALQPSTDVLQVADVGSSVGLVASLALSSTLQATGLFLVGNDAVVLGSAVSSAPAGSGAPSSTGSSGPGQAAPAPVGQTVPVDTSPDATAVVVVDLTDPEHPTVARSYTLQGDEVDARLIDGIVEVVVASSPDLPLVAPLNGSAAALSAAAATNRSVIESSTASSWLPSVTSEPSGTTATAPCGSALHTTSTTGTDTIGIVPIDPSADQPGSEVTVVGDATTVYASATALYVAFSAAADQPLSSGDGDQGGDTVIDAFDLSDPSHPTYVGAGAVPGTLIGQYAMSEYDGDLRVATTVGEPTPAPQDGSAPATLSDNRITVLAPQDQSLVTVGSVTGLGTGEKIYAVRFEGPLAYVVTFNQTDPLYVVDLSDPADPTLAGQLALTGYSSFLEPLDDGLLLGVGQEVDASLQDDGLQVSLFDVSNPDDPTLLAKDDIPDASSSAESDPHALLYWAADDMVVLPVDGGGFAQAGAGSPFDGAMAWSVAGNTLSRLGQITQPPTTSSSPAPSPVPLPVASPPSGTTSATAMSAPAVAGVPDIERAIVVGDTLYTVSDSGILASDLATLTPQQWMAFAS